MSTPPRVTRTGRKIVPTAAAAAAAADKVAVATSVDKAVVVAAGDKAVEKEKEKITPVAHSVTRAARGRPSLAAAAAAKVKEEVAEEAPKRRGLRSTAPTRTSESNDDSSSTSEVQVKKIKIEPQPKVISATTASATEAETQVQTEIKTQEIVDDSEIFEAMEKINAETATAMTAVNVALVEDSQQQTAVNSILIENTTATTTIAVDGTGAIEIREFATEAEAMAAALEQNPPWNEQGCIICNIDISLEEPVNQSSKSDQLKEFFGDFFAIGDQISHEDENSFPFCSKCAEEMEGLMSVSQNIEALHKQFNKTRDSMAKKAIKTFLCRTKPNYLEEDAKSETYGFMDEDQKRPYKDQMFHLWKSRYDLVQPGPKTPVVIRSMDSRGRVTVVRVNSNGQSVPDRFGGGIRGLVRSDVPLGLGGMGRLITNGDDEDSRGSGMGEVYQCKECPKQFSAKSLLVNHARVHSGELPYECEQCGKAFSVPHYLMLHTKNAHSGQKPYTCSECGKGFAQRGGLVTHSLVHTGAKPYCCQVCGKSFRQKYHLTQHNLIHSGVKPFSCDLCGKAFNVKMNLREHMRRHTGDRPYKCPYCTTVGFFRKKMLREHIVKSHPLRPMPEELMGPEASTSFAAESNSQEDDEDIEEGEEVNSVAT